MSAKIIEHIAFEAPKGFAPRSGYLLGSWTDETVTSAEEMADLNQIDDVIIIDVTEDGEDILVDEFHRSGDDRPETTNYPTYSDAKDAEVIEPLGESVDDYDVDAIAEKVIHEDSRGRFCRTVDNDTLSDLIKDYKRPDNERMSPEDFRDVMGQLGLTAPRLAEKLGVREDTVKKWKAGREPIPFRVKMELVQIAHGIIEDAQEVIRWFE